MENKTPEFSKKVLLLNIILSQALLVAAILVLKIFIIKENVSVAGFLQFNLNLKSFFITAAGSMLLVLLQVICYKYIPREKYFDELNFLLIQKFSLRDLFIIFTTGAIIEEILFRGLLQPFLGIVFSSMVFALIHIRYLTKIYIILEVFLMGIILGVVYQATGLLIVPIICHLLLNFLVAVMIKKGYMEY